MSKFALIINGDAERRHLENVERSLANVFKKEGYKTFVASHTKPKITPDHYVSANPADIQRLVETLKGKIGPHDELVIYTTGHGGNKKGKGTLCFMASCDGKDLPALLDGIPYGRRTVVMDQCYSGNWNKLFVDDPKTLFIAAGSKNEPVCCQEMAPEFWAPAGQVPDLNSDGVVSWQERYSHSSVGVRSSFPQFLPSPGYVDRGKPAFENKVYEVKDKADLQARLSQIKPGQYAVVGFSADWCQSCKKYRPRFEEMARSGNGQHLWMWTENEDLAHQWGIHAFPSVMLVDSADRKIAVQNIKQIPEEVAAFEVPELLRIEKRIAKANRIRDLDFRALAFARIAETLVQAGQEEKARTFFKKAIATAKRVRSPIERAPALGWIAKRLVRTGRREEGLSLFQEAITAAYRARGDEQFFSLISIANSYADAGLQVESLSLYETLITEVGDVDGELGKNLWDSSAVVKAITESLVRPSLGEKSIPAFEALISTTKQLDNPAHTQMVFGNITNAMTQAKWGAKSLPVFEKLYLDSKRIKQAYSRVLALLHIAEGMTQAGIREDVPKIFPEYFEEIFLAAVNAIYDEAIALAQEVRHEHSQALLFNNIARSLNKVGLGNKTLSHLETAIATAEQYHDHWAKGTAFTIFAESAIRAGLGHQSLPFYEKLLLAVEQANPLTYQHRCIPLSTIAAELHRLGYEERALILIERCIHTTQGSADHEWRSEYNEELAELLAKWGHRERASSLFDRAMADAKRIGYYHRRKYRLRDISKTMQEVGIALR